MERLLASEIGDSFLEWSSVLSGVPQGSFPGSMWFSKFELSISNKKPIFVGDTKLCREVN